MAKALHPIILSGGAGTRLWPLSRPNYPKQFIALRGGESLLSRTCRRVAREDLFAAPTLICNEEHRFLAAEHAARGGRRPRAILLEPEGRNTAPAIAVAALELAREDPRARLLVLPSDHWIADEEAFAAAVQAACAQDDHLMTFGVRPSGPETGFGYIEPGEALAGEARRVAAFHEKPDAATAERYLAEGYLWNSGMFVLPLDLLLAELEAHAPEVLAAAERSLAGARRDLDFTRLEEAAFRAAPSISFDYAVMEKTDRAGVLPVDMGWSDLGAWDALARLEEADAQGNRAAGNVFLKEAENTQARSDGPLIACLGTEDLLVVAHDDAVLVAPRDRAGEVKDLLSALEAAGFAEAAGGTQAYRPWGWYRNLEAGPGFLVKLIQVKPGARLSLQRHAHRAEHWIVVSGRARVTRDDEVLELGPNQSTYIPLGAAHRLENAGDSPLELIEVQSGEVISEDDIERLDDVYGRADDA